MSQLPTGWEMSTIGELGEVVRGVTFKKGDAVSTPRPGHLPILRATNINGQLLLDADMTYVPERFVREDQRLLVGDIVIATSSGSLSVVGKSAQLRRTWDGGFGAFCGVLRPDPLIVAAYLAHYVSTRRVREQWSEKAQGTNINNLKPSDIVATEIPVPPVSEQERIVSAIEEQFSRLDAGRSLLVRADENLKKLRFALESSVSSNVSDWVPLGEIADVVGGVTKDAKRQSDPEFVEVPYLRVANVQRGYLDLDKVTTIRVPPTTASKLRLEPGDVLFNEGGDRDKLGRGWIWEGQIADCIHQNHVFRARLNEHFDPKFVSIHGNTYGRTWFEKMGKQTTNLASLNLTTLKSFPVPNIPLERQRAILSQIERQASLLASLQLSIRRALAHCAALRSAVLASAFSGELVEQDPSDEPAIKLLETMASQRRSQRSGTTAGRRNPTSRQRKVAAL